MSARKYLQLLGRPPGGPRERVQGFILLHLGDNAPRAVEDFHAEVTTEEVEKNVREKLLGGAHHNQP